MCEYRVPSPHIANMYWREYLASPRWCPCSLELRQGVLCGALVSTTTRGRANLKKLPSYQLLRPYIEEQFTADADYLSARALFSLAGDLDE